VQLFGTGEGQTSPAGVDGLLALLQFPKPLMTGRRRLRGSDTVGRDAVEHDTVRRKQEPDGPDSRR
jgi:hypothetical protein